MKIQALLNPPPLFVEVGQDRLKAKRGLAGLELSLDREPDGHLTAQTRTKVIAALKNLVQAKNWLPRARAWCAISSRGISLRRLSLPGGTKEELQQRLLLQIEAEFPLAPEDLAWGCQPVGQALPTNGALPRQELLVAAVKKELVADYQEILRASGAEPMFTLAAMARWNFCGRPTGTFVMLEVGERQSEMTTFENGLPAVSRIVFSDDKKNGDPASGRAEALAQSLPGIPVGAKVFVSGEGISTEFTERLARSLGNGSQCERLETMPVAGNSAAIAGLEQCAGLGRAPSLLIRLESSGAVANGSTTFDWKTWGMRAGALATTVLLLPYAEALLLKPHLEKKVAAFKKESERLTVINRELEFLSDLKLSQPPYLDLVYVFAKSAPPETRFDSISLNRHGEVSWRATFRDAQQVADFRGQVIASGFFTNVVVEEQAPTPDHRKVSVRMSAQERPAADMQWASARLAADEAKKDDKVAVPGPATVPPGARKGPK